MKKHCCSFKSILVLIYVMLVGSSLSSCKKGGGSTAQTGETVVKINLKGVEAYYEDERNSVGQKQLSSKAFPVSKKAVDIQEMTVPAGNGCSIDVVLTSNSAAAAKKGLVASSGSKSATVAKVTEMPLEKDVKYKVIVYDDQGNYVTEKNYSYGGESMAEGITLGAGKTYTFIAYSINSTTTVPEISRRNRLTSASLDNISGNLMYFQGAFALNSGVNNLNIILKHRFSQITTTLTVDPSIAGKITRLGDAVFRPSFSTASLKLSDEVLSYNKFNDTGVSVQFPNLGSGVRTAVSSPILLIHPETSQGVLELKNVTIEGENPISLVKDITIPNIKINPGQKYDLKLNFKRCSKTVSKAELDRNYPELRGAWVRARYIAVNGKYLFDGHTIEHGTFQIPPEDSDNGFIFDITELDDSFNMEVNGVKLVNEEIKFGFGENVQFEDGSMYGGTNRETGGTIDRIFSLRGSNERPLVRVVVSPTGQVSMFGSKTSGGELYPLSLIGSSFNQISPWDRTRSYNIKVTQLVAGTTIIKARILGKKITACN